MYMRRQYPPGPKITPRDFGAQPSAAHHQPLAGTARELI
jgi:hypothetical protein